MQVLGAKGFRPLFLLAGVQAAVVVPAWVAIWMGSLQLHGALSGVLWHAHEMVFGFTVAVIAGFLLTAAENWTGQPTLRGGPLLLLAGLWTSARVALLLPGWLGPLLQLLVLPLAAAGIGKALWVAGNRRNAPLVALLGLLWLANVAVFLDVFGVAPGLGLPALRAAVWLVATIIVMITGRVVPMFTRNGTGDTSVYSVVLLDRAALGSTLAVALLQLFPQPTLLALAAGVGGVAVLARQVGWFSSAVLRHPLLWVLHAGHAAVGLGLCALAAAAQLGLAPSIALHAVTVGGIGLLTVGMMVRVGLGHTGRELRAGRGAALVFSLVVSAALVRTLGPWLSPLHTLLFLQLSAALWGVAFVGFTLKMAPILMSSRVDGRPG